MNTNKSIGRTIGSCAVAVVLALLTPIGMASSMRFLFAPVVFVWLYAWAGVLPCLLFVSGTLLFGVLMGGGVFACLCALSLFVPACVALYMIRLRKSYMVCMGVSVLVQIAALLLSLTVAWLLLRENLVDALLRYLGDRMKEYPSAMTDSLILLYGQLGQFAESGIDFAKGYLEEAERLRAIDLFAAAVTDGLKLALPSLILTSGITTGILNVAVPVWIWSRRGDERAVRRVPLSEWRVPRNTAIGLPLCMLTAYILYRMGVAGSDSAYTAVYNIFLLMLELQALGVISRTLKRRGMGRGGRVVMLLLALTVAYIALYIIGAASLYLGSQGVISSAIRKKMKNRDGEE